MVTQIEARTLLASVQPPDPLFGLRYNMNLYRGCQHQCIYCDSRSACYGIDDFADVQVKANALQLLPRELAAKRKRGTIGFGAMNDCYMPVEAHWQLTRQALEMIAARRFPVHILTKSDLVRRDLDLLARIAEVYAAVTFTITTARDDLARQLEPGAPPPSARLAAMSEVARAGILTGTALMPVLPFLEDTDESVAAVVEATAAAGGRYVLAGFGVTLRDRQRDHFYAQLDRLFPGVRPRYEAAFRDRYECPSPRAAALARGLEADCRRRGLATRMPVWAGDRAAQLQLFPS
ncbi:MAG: radical SAM protein [Gemmatimonadota bacterium]